MLLVQNVSKLYRLYSNASDRIRELILFRRRSLHTEFWALQNVSFAVDRGEILSLVGPNGCGKSTLLQVISGILQPTSGRVVTRGRIAALLELGAGFNPEFSGKENVLINGEIMGLSRIEMARNLPKIEAFAEIGEFIDRPVKEYSTGMYVRLAFSTAIHVDPDILIVDEALAVGDAVFANRCIRKFEELREQKITIIFVSHDLGLVKQLSHRAIFLLNGRIVAQGDPKHVIDRYVGVVLERQKAFDRKQISTTGLTASHRHGDGSSEIVHVETVDEAGLPSSAFAIGEMITILIRSIFHDEETEPMVGILIRNRIGMDVYGTNTKLEGLDLGSFARGDELNMKFRFECRLTPQQYTVTVATQHADGSSHDWLDDVVSFEVLGSKQLAGVADLKAIISWSKQAPHNNGGE